VRLPVQRFALRHRVEINKRIVDATEDVFTGKPNFKDITMEYDTSLRCLLIVDHGYEGTELMIPAENLAYVRVVTKK
jgi:hypothetical protein